VQESRTYRYRRRRATVVIPADEDGAAFAVVQEFVMTERRSILGPKPGHRPIGYAVGDEAFDLSGRKRCRYNADTGNLHDLETDRIVGYVSLDGRYGGSSFESQRLFNQPTVEESAANVVESGTLELSEPTTDEPSTDEDATVLGIARAPKEMARTVSESDVSFERALAIIMGEN